MPYMTFHRRCLIVCGAAVLLLMLGCRQQMADQPRYDPFEKSTFFPDMLSARPLAVGAVPHDFVEQDEFFDLGLINGQPADRLPFAITLDVLHRGKERYEIYCTPCHDYVGTGHGMAALRGFRKPPPSFHSEELRAAPPGHFFDVMTNGFGAMPSYAYQIEARDRWDIVAYIRALQLSQWETVNDVPADERQKLEAKR